MNKKEPTHVTKVLDIPEGTEIFQKGDGTIPRFNKIQFIEFDSEWWIVKISVQVRTQPLCFIIIYVDQLGNIKYSKDNIYSINTREEENILSDYIKCFIIDFKKDIV